MNIFCKIESLFCKMVSSDRINSSIKFYLNRTIYLFLFFAILVQPLRGMFKINEIGTRPLALGGAFTGVADDIYSLLYNPAGMVNLDLFETSFGYNNIYGLDGLTQNYFLSGINFKKYGALGFGYAFLNLEYVYKEYIWILSYANFISQNISLGCNFKYFGFSIDENFNVLYSYTFKQKIGIDLGVLIYINEWLKIGASVMNVNKPEILRRDGPPVVRLGFAFYLFDFIRNYFKSLNSTETKKLLFSLDIYQENFVNDKKNQTIFNLGAEYFVNNSWQIMVGTDLYKTFSAGIKFNIKRFLFEYSFVTQSEIVNNNHLFSVGFKF